MSVYSDFENEWIGKRKDYDGVAGYQCVDLVKQYVDEKYGIKAGAWGDAKNYWLNTNPGLLTKFDKLNSNDAQAGDIVPLKPIDAQPSHSAGHIGIATGAKDSANVEILEQNGNGATGTGTGSDAIRKRFVPRSRVYGLLRPKTATQPQMPPVGSKIQLIPVDTRTTFRAGTTTQAGTIHVSDNSFIYTVRGYDSKYPGRIIINSASAGGDGVALALYYTSGALIPGWKVT